MTDTERELHIKACGQLMEQAYANYEASGSFSDIGEAHAWRKAMQDAINGRSAEQVARMEQERGIA